MFAQTTPYSQQLWLQEAAFNPASSGLKTKVDAFAGYSYLKLIGQFYHTTNQAVVGQANFYLPAINSGVGVSFNRDVYSEEAAPFDYDWEGNITSENYRLNYNYQFHFKKERVLSVGTALTVRSYQWSDYSFSWCGVDNYPREGKISQTSIALGAIYATTNWQVGFSLSPTFVFAETKTTAPITLFSEYNLFTAYRFNMGKHATLTPRLYLSWATEDYYMAAPASSLGLIFENHLFLMGVDLAFADYTYVNGTLGITVFRQFNFLYTAGLVLDEYVPETTLRHTFGVRFAMGK